MRLTRQTNYAMRILMYCAANTDRLSRIPEIAAAYSVSELFLFKILQPLVEAGLFYFVGRLVDILDQLPGERSWHALWAAAGPELLFMGAVVLVIRTAVVGLSALVDEQTITPGFYNLVRWQAHRHVSRQSYAFFQNDFAGRIATKVWQAGQATGDLMESFIEVIWFMIIYTVTTLALVAGLDLRLAVLVVVWIAVFGWLAK
ncbi:MAG: hypothetical protein E5V99_23600, partial [Mesorhizobium sp.]